MAKKGGLGRGVNALFNEDDERMLTGDKSQADSVVTLKIVDVEPNLNQPRKDFDEEKLDALAQSIKQHGVISPIIVEEYKPGYYQIIAGERRWRASKKAGLKEIPAIIRSYDRQTTMEVALIENIQRENLNPIEEALAFRKLMDEFELTQEAISEKVARSRSAVANALRLLSLPESIKSYLSEGKISAGHARAILSLDNEDLQIQLAELIIKNELSVRRAEQAAKDIAKPKAIKSKIRLSPEIKSIEKSLQQNLGTKVKISDNGKKGKIEIEYYGDDDLSRILKLINM